MEAHNAFAGGALSYMVNWEAVGAVAEGLGAVVVVISVVYLASQVKQANLQGQGVAHTGWLTTWNETIKGWIADRDTVQVLQRGFDDFHSLSRVEQAIFSHQMAAFINHWHLAADLCERGLLGQAVYAGATQLVLSVCSTPGAGFFLRSAPEAFPRGPQLVHMLDAGEAKLPPFNAMAPWWSASGEAFSEKDQA